MRHNPAPIIGGFYTDEDKSWALQDTVNFLPVVAEDRGTRSQTMLKMPPGLRPWQKIGDGPIRGLYTAENRLFCVSGSKMYQVTSAGIGIPLGNMPGVGRVTMAHNQIANGNEVMAVNGTSGYIYNTYSKDYTKITDSGFPGAKSVCFLDQFFLFVEPFGRYAGTSDLAAGTAYNTLDRFQAESSPDTLQCVLPNQGEAVLFGQRTSQWFANTGAATGTFQSKGVTIQRGAVSAWCVGSLDNTLIWVGDDKIVYRLNGYSPQRISTGPIERELAKYNLANCFCTIWEDRGFKVYYLTVIGGPTFGYHAENGLWVRRSTWNPRTDIAGRWRPSALAYFNNQWIAGDAYSGELYVMDWDYFLDRDRPMVRERITSMVTDNQNRVVADYLELVIPAAGEASIAPNPLFPTQPVGPTISGNSPNAFIGQDYAFAYILAAGDNPIVKVEIRDSDLPDGFEVSSTGILTGPTDAQGSYTYRVRATDSVGLFAEVRDTLDIGGAWWLTGADPPGEVNTLYISASGKDFSGARMTTRLPAINTNVSAIAGGGYRQFSPDLTVAFSADGYVELARSFRDTDGVLLTDVVQAAPGIGASDALAVSGGLNALVMTRRNGANYFTSSDQGNTWTERTSPDSLRLYSVAYLMSGIWIGVAQFGTEFHFYHSAQTVPTDWTQSDLSGTPGSAAIPSETNKIVSNGETAICVYGASSAKTLDGINWAVSAHGVEMGDMTCGAAAGQVFIFGGTNADFLMLTLDAGANWESVPFRNTRRIDVYDGLWVACCPGEAGGIFWSEDDGESWHEALLPDGIDSSFYSSIYVAPIKFLPGA